MWLCPSHHCDTCGRSASMSCAFCPTAFCSEHFHDNVKLTEYYQLACLKHSDVVLCEDPNVLKIYGLCKTPKTSSSRKPQHRKSGNSAKRIRRDDGKNTEGEGGAMSESRTVRHSRKSLTSVLDPRESNPKRSCRDRDVKKSELEQSMSTNDLSVRPSEGARDAKRHRKKEEQQRDKQLGFRETETGRKRSRSTDRDGGTVHSGPSWSSEDLKRGKKRQESPPTGDHRQRQTHKKQDVNREHFRKTDVVSASDYGRHRTREPDVEMSAGDHRKHRTHKQDVLLGMRKTDKATASDHSRRRTHEPDVDRHVQKRRKIQERESTGGSTKAGLDYFSSLAATKSASALRLTDFSGTVGTDVHSTVKPSAKSAITSAKSYVDEPLFDNSDDEFPELVIDVPTI